MSKSIVSRHNKNAVIMKFLDGDSNKKDKLVANRKFRRKNKIDAKKSLLSEDDKFGTYNIKEVFDTWNFRSDGLSHYWDISDYSKEEQRKLKSK